MDLRSWWRRWWRAGVGGALLLSVPALAEAHILNGSGGWTDELVCLVPAAVLLALVMVVGRNPKPGPTDGPPPSPEASLKDHE
jgi:hypothetical protein